LSNYQAVFELPEFWQAMWNGVVVSVGTVVVAITVAVPAAYVLTRSTFHVEGIALAFPETWTPHPDSGGTLGLARQRRHREREECIEWGTGPGSSDCSIARA
jgi:hypothetical protein